MSKCAMGRETKVYEWRDGLKSLSHADDGGTFCLGPACTSPKPISDTERLDWLEKHDPPIAIEWDGLSTWSLEVPSGIRLYQCSTLRTAIDAAILAARKEGK